MMALNKTNSQIAVIGTPNRYKMFKVIVIGDSGVGKTTLTYRFCEGKFLESAEATTGLDFRSRIVNIYGEDIMLQLWDTAGQEKMRYNIVHLYYKNAHAVIIVYDVTNSKSFASLSRWMEEVRNNHLEDVPMILVGNKCDGIPAVTHKDAQRFADQHNMPLIVTSAKLDSQFDNVEAILMSLALKLNNQEHFLPATVSTDYDRIVLNDRNVRSKDESKNHNASSCC